MLGRGRLASRTSITASDRTKSSWSDGTMWRMVGWETFLSYEDPLQDILIGLLRLRRLNRKDFEEEFSSGAEFCSNQHGEGVACLRQRRADPFEGSEKVSAPRIRHIADGGGRKDCQGGAWFLQDCCDCGSRHQTLLSQTWLLTGGSIHDQNYWMSCNKAVHLNQAFVYCNHMELRVESQCLVEGKVSHHWQLHQHLSLPHFEQSGVHKVPVMHVGDVCQQWGMLIEGGCLLGPITFSMHLK